MGDEEVDPRFSADLEPSGRSISSRGSGLLGVVSPVVRDDDSDGDEDEEINREVSFCSRCRSEVGCRRPSFNRGACVCVFALKRTGIAAEPTGGRDRTSARAGASKFFARVSATGL